MEQIMPQRRHLLILTMALVLPWAPAMADRYNRGVSSVHQPIVQRDDYVLDVPAGALGIADRDRILQWFAAINLGYGDRVSIDGRAAGDATDTSSIAALVGRYGLFVTPGAPITQGDVAAGNLRIIVSRSTASVAGCPDWSQPSQPNFTSSAMSNYGCAINSTMAAMVADPQDLVRGVAAQGGDAETATKAIRSWREAMPTAKGGLKVESVKGGQP
ncbi:pilus assembly protein CpaD [Sphingomonas sp. YR710]|jgi:pilus assembly protein CpaD|uniref:CpaD family pilus assembly protein n=1 Tax=Sphingomonas sp. YR710 TaxID=1882773 RepID=UPI00088BA0A9|nr:CpaD family pilus assembly lipoprotein [Sphingomonas sp. YR710]SDC46057.1 pilus assembly protein CpaD [Sphingomonas sp. YR710]